MKLAHLYLVLCVLGAALPYSQFVPFLLENGLDIPMFVQQLFANRISAFFGMDVIVSAVVVTVFVLAEGTRIGIRHTWLPIVATFTVGVSLGLPLFLYLRQCRLEANSQT